MNITEAITKEIGKLYGRIDDVGQEVTKVSGRVERLEEIANQTLIQAKTTNGRVTELEKKHIANEAKEAAIEEITKPFKNLVWQVVGAVAVFISIAALGVIWAVVKLVA